MKMQAKCILNTGETREITVDLDYASDADDVYAQCNNALMDDDKFVRKIENLDEIIEQSLKPYIEMVSDTKPADSVIANPEGDHPQTVIYATDPHTGEPRKIICDVEIAPVVKRLNEVGAYTKFSCQDLNNSGIAQFGFDHNQVNKDQMMHALDIIGAAFPGRILYITANLYFDPIICAAKDEQALDKYILFTQSFNPSTRVVEDHKAYHAHLSE